MYAVYISVLFKKSVACLIWKDKIMIRTDLCDIR